MQIQLRNTALPLWTKPTDNTSHGHVLHQTAAIWTDMDHVLKDIMVEANSFAVLLPTEIQECNMEFPTSHGKGAPDGIGATVKRCADPVVLRGEDIVDGRHLH